jgi:hypothetical protein
MVTSSASIGDDGLRKMNSNSGFGGRIDRHKFWPGGGISQSFVAAKWIAKAKNAAINA